MRVSELTGAVLDCWVARGLARDADGAYAETLGRASIVGDVCVLPPKFRAFRPSTDWSAGGPVIEDRRISVNGLVDRWEAHVESHIEAHAVQGRKQSGNTALQAAMRAYVASRFGEEFAPAD